MRRYLLLFFVLLSLIVSPFVFVYADDKSDLEKKVADLQKKLDDTKQQKSTLSSQITYMNTQIDLATYRIQETQQKIIDTQKEIENLTGRIEKLDTSLNHLSELMIKRVVDGYKQGNVSMFDFILNSNQANDFINQLKYFKTAQENNQKILVQVQEIKFNFEEQKQLREKKKVELDTLQQTLADQKVQLDTQKQQKQRLLAETQNDESTYQRLLSQAKAQLAAFSRFVASQGGSGLLGNQTVCDDWGCYYNQRDSQWGGTALNGTGYTLADSGCLISSIAMIYTHYGHKGVTPQTINGNSSNFASYYPAYLNFSVSADGATASRVSIGRSGIDDALASGSPVIAGISYDGGPVPDHYLVLVSGSNGNYIMNDPYTENGHKIPLTSRYSVGSIVAAYRVSL